MTIGQTGGSPAIQGQKNSVYTPGVIAMEALRRLKYELILPRLANHNFSAYFGGQIGTEISVKLPYMAKAFRGRVIADSDVNPMVDKLVRIKLDKRTGFALEYNDEELTFDITDFGDRYLRVGAEEMAHGFDEDGMEELGTSLFRHIGTVGTALKEKTIKDVRARFTMCAIPLNSRNYAIVHPKDLDEMGEDLKKNIFVSDMVEGTIRDRFQGKASNFLLFESANCPLQKTGTHGGTPKMRGANQTGGSLVTDGWTNNSKVLLKGEIITIAGVKEVKQRGRRDPTGYDAQFVVTSDVTANGSGQATIPVYPELNDGSLTQNDGDGTSVSLSAFQNVDSKPADDAAITILGDGSSTYRQTIFYEQDALEFVNVTLQRLKSANLFGQAVDGETGLSITMMADLDVRKAEELTRLDSAYGVKTVYPELGVRCYTEKE